MSEITEEKKEVILELRHGLNGKCDKKWETCPGSINARAWGCEDCISMFLWLNKDRKPGDCPCHCIPFETLDLRFSELLEEPL